MTAQNTPAGPQDRRNTDRPRETANARAFAHTSSILPGRAACIADSMTACIADSMTDTMSGCNPCAPRGGVAQAPRRRGALIGRGGLLAAGNSWDRNPCLRARGGKRACAFAHTSPILSSSRRLHTISRSLALSCPRLAPSIPCLFFSFLLSPPFVPSQRLVSTRVESCAEGHTARGGKGEGQREGLFQPSCSHVLFIKLSDNEDGTPGSSEPAARPRAQTAAVVRD